MADTCKAGSQGRDLIHDLFGSKLGLRISHTVHQVDKNIGIQAHLAFQCHRFTDTLYSSLRIAEGAFLLRITGTGQDHIRILRGLCHEQIGQHQEIQAFQCLADMMLVCIRYDRSSPKIKSPRISLRIAAGNTSVACTPGFLFSSTPHAFSNLAITSGFVTF